MRERKKLSTRLAGNESSWAFIGMPRWKQDEEGHIYPPSWSHPDFLPDDPAGAPNPYADELAREDYAFLTSRVLADLDMSVGMKQFYGSVVHGGIVFRVVDSARFYVLDVVNMGRKGQDYKLSLWVQDETGYRRELATGFAPHSIVGEDIVQRGVRNREEWDKSSPDWAVVRVEARGNHIRVSMDGKPVFEVEDETYEAGYIGLVARGPLLFKDLHVEGTEGDLPGAWTRHEGELPRFFYPGGVQPQGFNAYPVVSYGGGRIFVAWAHGAHAFRPTSVVLTRSEDEGTTWTKPRTIFCREGWKAGAASLLAHLDGSLSCLVGLFTRNNDEQELLIITSADGGETWSEPTPFRPGGKQLRDYGPVSLYSPMIRLSDGTVVMTGYKHQTVPGGDVERNADRLDQSFLIRSEDDGHTWGEPVYFDRENFDHNECMLAETEPGKLVAFMRTLRARNMWTSTSVDGGLTWTPLVQSNVSGECPQLLKHSSGTLILTSRGCGTFVKLSFDQGKSWTKNFRISPASAMVGMTEVKDGRVLIVMHEGYRAPGYIRAQFFRVTRTGPEPAP